MATTREAITMELTQYKKVRAAVQSNASPAALDDIKRVEHELRESLLATGVFDDVEVDHTDNPDGLVIAMCKFPGQMNRSQVAAKLELAWQDRLRFEFWEAHATLIDDDQIEFQGATRAGSNGTFVTLHVVAQKGPIPAQRVR